MRTRPARFAAAVVAAAAVLGCGRVNTATEVQPDGTWVRTLTFHGPKAEEPPGAAGSPRAEELFGIPSGAPWRVARTTEGDEAITRATRTLRPGETLREDIRVMAGSNLMAGLGALAGPAAPAPPQRSSAPPRKPRQRTRPPTPLPSAAEQSGAEQTAAKSPAAAPTVLVTNEVTVRSVGPGRWAYHEVLHWRAERPKEFIGVPPEVTRALRDALPAGAASDADIQAIAQTAMRGFWQMLFGPGDPLLAQLPMMPDLVERKMRRQIGQVLDRSLEARLGSRVAPAERRAAVQKLLAGMLASPAGRLARTSPVDTKPGQSEPPSGPGGLASLTFSLKLPGRLVSTNGDYDEVTGEVFWAMYALAPAMADVELDAVWECAP